MGFCKVLILEFYFELFFLPKVCFVKFCLLIHVYLFSNYFFILKGLKFHNKLIAILKVFIEYGFYRKIKL